MSASLIQTLKENRLGYLLMGGHICVDMCQGGLSAAIPFLVHSGGYSYAQVTMLVFMANIASAVIQPLFGWLGDKKACPWFMALGVFLAALGYAGIGLFDVYWQLALSSMVSGVGIAMLHPEGGRLANLVAQHSKAGGVSIFTIGGQIGFCLGPIIAAAALSIFGMHGAAVFLVVCIPYAILLLAFNGKFAAFGLRDNAAVEAAGGKDRWGAFSLVISSLSMRSVLYYGVTSFVPSFMIVFFAWTESQGSMAVSVFALAGAIATIFSSKIAAKIGTQRLLIICFAVISICTATFAYCGSVIICIVMLIVLSIAMNSCNPPAIALAQSYVPNHLGTASGLSFGVAVCIGGVVSPALGVLGDAAGLQPVFLALAAFAAVGFLLAIAVLRLRPSKQT